MRSSITTATGVIAGVSTLALSTLAYGATNDRAGHRDLSVISSNGPFVDMDFNNLGVFEMGDQFAYLNPLSRDGKVIGQQAGQCTVMQFTSWEEVALFNCIDTLDLPEGQITVMTLVHSDQPPGSPAAITGGSGSYRDAQGQVRVTDLPDGTKRLDIQLSS